MERPTSSRRHHGRHMGSRCMACCTSRGPKGLVGLGLMITWPRLDAVRATGFRSAACCCCWTTHACAGGDAWPDVGACPDGVAWSDVGVWPDVTVWLGGGVWPGVSGPEWMEPAPESEGAVAEAAAVAMGLLTEAAAAAGTWDSNARDTDLARYSTSRRPTTESRPGNDNRKLHASLAQWLNPSCEKDENDK